MHKCLDIYHPNLHFISRRAWGPIQPRGNRAIHLLHSLFCQADVAMLENVRKKTYPTADQLSLKLVKNDEGETITLTLSEALARFNPFTCLVPTKPGTKKTPGTYSFFEFPNPALSQDPKIKGPLTRRYYKRRGRSKEIHLNTDFSATTLSHQVQLAYGFLQEGSRIEVHLRSKAEASAESVDSALKHRLHLRPDTILAAMPPGTTMLAIPATLQPPEEEPRRASKFEINKTSDVFWAMENRRALRRTQIFTPSRLREVGKWDRDRTEEFIKATLEIVHERRKRKALRRQIRDEGHYGVPAWTLPKGVTFRKRDISARPLLSRTLKEVVHGHKRPAFLQGRPANFPEDEDGDSLPDLPDLPDLSDLMPEREREDGLSEPDPGPNINFVPFHISGGR